MKYCITDQDSLQEKESEGFEMQNFQVLEVQGKRVLTTKQIAEAYEADVKTIQYNFRYNKERYELGKHYIEITGDELRRLKTRNEFQSSLKYAKSLYLWTEKGALLHAKSLNTEKAWEVYDYLVDFYFRAKEKPTPEKTSIVPVADTAEPSKAHPQTALPKSGFDIAPAFRELISLLPVEALDEMEKCFRNEKSIAIKLAATSILAEKMKRQLA